MLGTAKKGKEAGTHPSIIFSDIAKELIKFRASFTKKKIGEFASNINTTGLLLKRLVSGCIAEQLDFIFPFFPKRLSKLLTSLCVHYHFIDGPRMSGKYLQHLRH
ncbi:hypothetical protein ACU8KH_05515 [Lachancea thermotolerans]